MAINIKTKPDADAAAAEETSAHAEAAAAIETEVSKETQVAGEDPQYEVETESQPVKIAAPYERIEVGMALKMKVAEYTMLTLSVTRSVPYKVGEVDPDGVFEEVHGWVEAKLNALIAEQQGE